MFCIYEFGQSFPQKLVFDVKLNSSFISLYCRSKSGPCLLGISVHTLVEHGHEGGLSSGRLESHNDWKWMGALHIWTWVILPS